MAEDTKKTTLILSICGIIPTIWIALLIAPSVDGGLAQIMKEFSSVMNNPFNITWCSNSLRVLLICLLIYGCGIALYISSKGNYRRGEEHGSAKWGNARAVNKKYYQSPNENNKLLTQNVSIGLNAKKHRRNLNTLVCGGSGAGKTRFYCKPNIMQCNTSFVVLDPPLRKTGRSASLILAAANPI